MAMSPGEKRRRKAKRERSQTAYKAAIAPLRAAGRSCASCHHYTRVPLSTKHHCAEESDHNGYAIVQPSYVCHLWQARPST